MRTLIITLGSGLLLGATLTASLLLPQLPASEPPLARQSKDFTPWPGAALDCPALRKAAWQEPGLQPRVEDRSQQQVSAYASRQAGAAEQGVQLFGVYNGTPRIALDASAQPATLLLTSAENSIWSIELTGDAEIQRIYTLGPVAEVRLSRKTDASWLGKLKRALGVTAPLTRIELLRLDHQQACGLYAYDWRKDGKAEFRSFLAAAQKITGLPAQSFQGSYSPQPNSLPFSAPLSPAAKDAPKTTPVAQARTASTGEARVHSPAELTSEIRRLIESGILPAQLASMDMAGGGELMQFERIDLDPREVIHADAQGHLACPPHGDSSLAGDDAVNIVDCGFGNTLIYAGGDKDLIEDAWGNDIIYGGTGNDSLDAGWGSDILLFERGWGEDVIDKTCHNAQYDAASTPGADMVDYRWRFNNFIVFGPGIRPQDLQWQGSRLLHSSGDSLEFKDNNRCFNFVFADDPHASLP